MPPSDSSSAESDDPRPGLDTTDAADTPPSIPGPGPSPQPIDSRPIRRGLTDRRGSSDRNGGTTRSESNRGNSRDQRPRDNRGPGPNPHFRSNSSGGYRSNSGARSGPLSYRGPASHLPAAANRRLSEIEAAGEPLSLSERISIEGDRAKAADRTPQTVDGVSIAQLHRLNTEELRAVAIEEQIERVEDASRQQLIYQIMKRRLKARGLLYGEGTLEVLPDGFGFLRSAKNHYQSGPDDIYVSPSQIRKFGLRDGMMIAGQIRPPKENEGYFALLRVDAINYRDPKAGAQVKRFDELTPVHPDSRIHLEHDPQDMATRIIDMMCPLGFGQRGLIVSPPRAGKTMLMQKMAIAIQKNFPEVCVIILLIDERPEEVTDMKRSAVITGQCEVISSTFDESPERHIQVAEMVATKARRLVECGLDVVVLMDSITRLARAYNASVPQGGKTMSGGLDTNAMQAPKAFFGSARKVEEGGSLTIVATALIDTGSRMDDVIFEEFKGTGNMEIVLDRHLADRRILPAIELNSSGTRREERLLEAEELRRINAVRRVLTDLSPADALESLMKKLAKTKTNAEFLMSINPERM